MKQAKDMSYDGLCLSGTETSGSTTAEWFLSFILYIYLFIQYYVQEIVLELCFYDV